MRFFHVSAHVTQFNVFTIHLYRLQLLWRRTRIRRHGYIKLFLAAIYQRGRGRQNTANDRLNSLRKIWKNMLKNCTNDEILYKLLKEIVKRHMLYSVQPNL